MRKWGYGDWFSFGDRLLTWSALLNGIVIALGLALALIGLAWGDALAIKRESKIDPFFISIDPTYQVEHELPDPAWQGYKLDDTPLDDTLRDGGSGRYSCPTDQTTSNDPALDAADSVEFTLVMDSSLSEGETEPGASSSAHHGDVESCGQDRADEQDILWRNWQD